MSTEQGSPIRTYSRVCDGVRVGYADTRLVAVGRASCERGCRSPLARPRWLATDHEQCA
jgi:hypothetical protein